jgi:hypothetical protein
MTCWLPNYDKTVYIPKTAYGIYKVTVAPIQDVFVATFTGMTGIRLILCLK